MTTTKPEPITFSSALIDALARSLFQPVGHCSSCGQPVTLADALQFICPCCGGQFMPGPDITPERGREMLGVLLERRAALGLPITPGL